MESLLNNEAILKQLLEEPEKIKKEIAQKSTELNFISLQNDFLQKNVQWLQIFVELAEKKEEKRSKLLDSYADNQLIFSELVCNIFDNGLMNNICNKKDKAMDMAPLIKTMDELIDDTDSVFKFYNDLPIVKTYKALNFEYQETEDVLRSWAQKNPILEGDNQHFNLLFKERNRLFISMITNSKKIENITNKIKTMSQDLNKTLLNKNEVIKDFHNQIEELQKKKQEYVTSKFTLSHIDIFKIPTGIVLKNTLIQNKFKEKENKRSAKKCNKIVPTFPILPLHRNSNSIEDYVNPSKLQKLSNIQIIENIQIKTGQDHFQKLDEATVSKFNVLETKIMKDSIEKNIDISNKNKQESIVRVPNSKKTKRQDTEVEHKFVQQKSEEFSQNSEITEKNKNVIRETIKNDNITVTSSIDQKQITFKDAQTKCAKDKFINKLEIPIEKNYSKCKPEVTLKYLTTQNTDLNVVQDVSPKKRFRYDLDSLKKKKIIQDENKIPHSSKLLKEISPKGKSENVEQKTQSKHDKNTNKNANDIFKMDFDAISSVDSENSVKPPEECDFNFDDGNINFDEIGDGNNFFDNTADLDFSSDNQFGVDCDSFKF